MIGAGCRATSGAAAGGRRRSRTPTPSAQAMPTSTGSGTSRRGRTGAGGVTGAITGGDCGEAFGRLSGWAVASGGLVASTSAGSAEIDRRSTCGRFAGRGEAGDDCAGVGAAETCCVGRTSGWMGRTIGRPWGRGSVRISGRFIAAIVRAGESGAADTLPATVGVAGTVRGSACRGAAVSCGAGSVSDAARSDAARSDAAGSDAPGSDPARAGASGGATGAGDAGPGFSGAGAAGAATGPGSATDGGAGVGAGAAVGAALSGRSRSGSTYPFGSLVRRTPRWT
jgi:hypothetical protein